MAFSLRKETAFILDEIERELWDLGQDIVAAAVLYLDRRGVNAEGDLRNSITEEVAREIGQMRLTVGPNAEHGPFVELGTKPHWTPVAPLRRWVVKKLGIEGKNVDRVLHAIRFKISQVGTQARPYMATALRLYRNVIASRIADAIQLGINRAG